MPNRMLRPTHLLIGLLALLGWASLAAAAGHLFPQPIRLCEIGVWLDTRLTASPTAEERQAIIAAHDRYWAEYRTLEERELEPFENAEPQSWRDPKDWADRRRKLFSLADRIAELDAALFAAIEAALPEERRLEFASARQARAIDRTLDTDRLGGSGPSDVRIVEVLRELRTLTPEERTAIEPRLRDYEPRLASLSKERLAAVRRFIDRSQEHVRERVERGEAMSTAYPAGRADAEREMPDWTAPQRKLQAAIAACRKEIAGLVSFEASRELAVRLYASNLYDPLFTDQFTMDARFRAALRMAPSDDAKGEIEAAYKTWAKADDAFVDELLVALASPASALALLQNPIPQQERRKAIADPALTSLHTILGPEVGSKLWEATYRTDQFAERLEALAKTSIEESMQRTGESALLRHVASNGTSANEDNANRWRMDWKPRPLDEDLVLAWFADATPDERLTAATAIRDAKARWEKETLPALEAIEAKRSAVEREGFTRYLDPTSGDPPTVADYQALAESMIVALDAVVAADRATFDDLAAVFGEARSRPLALARAERELAIWADGETLLSVPYGYEVLPNLPTLLRTSTPALVRPAAEAAVLESVDELRTVARERRVARLRSDAHADWSRGREFGLQQSIQRRLQAGQLTNDDASKEWEAIAAARAEEGARRRVDLEAFAAQAVAWRAVFDRMLERITKAAGDAVADEERASLRIAYERLLSPPRFQDIRDPGYLYARLRRALAADAAATKAIEAREQNARRELDRWLLATLDGYRANPIVLTSDEDRRGMLREGFLRADRAERHTRAAWALRPLVPADQPALARLLREYDLLCVLAGTRWWDE